jgi:hypothetical protein
MAQIDTASGRTLGEPTTEQWVALQAWATKHGRFWKQALRDAWMSGDYGTFEDSGYLQQIRNTFGPRWLSAIDINASK